MAVFGIGTAGFINGGDIVLSEKLRCFNTYNDFLFAPFAYNKYKEKVFGRGGFRLGASVALYISLFIVVIAFLVNATYNPFLYFRF